VYGGVVGTRSDIDANTEALKARLRMTPDEQANYRGCRTVWEHLKSVQRMCNYIARVQEEIEK